MCENAKLSRSSPSCPLLEFSRPAEFMESSLMTMCVQHPFSFNLRCSDMSLMSPGYEDKRAHMHVLLCEYRLSS